MTHTQGVPKAGTWVCGWPWGEAAEQLLEASTCWCPASASGGEVGAMSATTMGHVDSDSLDWLRRGGMVGSSFACGEVCGARDGPCGP